MNARRRTAELADHAPEAAHAVEARRSERRGPLEGPLERRHEPGQRPRRDRRDGGRGPGEGARDDAGGDGPCAARRRDEAGHTGRTPEEHAHADPERTRGSHGCGTGGVAMSAWRRRPPATKPDTRARMSAARGGTCVEPEPTIAAV